MKLDKGYQFGLGAFETMAVEKGQPLFLQAHINRLKHTLEWLHIFWNEEILYRKMNQQLQTHAGCHEVIKLMVSDQNILTVYSRNRYQSIHYHHGARLGFSTIRRNDTSPFTFHKTFNYGDCIREKRHALLLGLDELLFLNTKGQLAEGTTSNIFFVKQGRLYTPAATCGLLPGILRDYICNRYDVCQAELYPQDIPAMDECFITNSLMGIMPVRQLEDIVFPGYQGPCTKSLLQQYQHISGWIV